MKKFVMAVVSFASISAVAGPSATLNLKGSVASNIDISIQAETLATNLPLDQALTNQKVGKVVERSNSGSGYKVSVASKNGGKLVNTVHDSHYVSYQLSYGNQNLALNKNGSTAGTHSGLGQYERDLLITYSKPSDYLASGDYTDDVIFTISAN